MECLTPRRGQFFTPLPIVEAMVEWCRQRRPGQVVDAGCGTGRFAIAAAQTLPAARIIAMDCDPVATLLCRAEVARLGLHNVDVRCADFLTADLALGPSRAAFLGNPPDVRHHRLTPATKRWGAEAASRLGVSFSGRNRAFRNAICVDIAALGGTSASRHRRRLWRPTWRGGRQRLR